MTAARRALDELIVVPSNGLFWVDLAAIADQDDLDEMAHSDFPPSIEVAESEPVDPGPFEAEPDTIVLVDDPIPEWVLADALELQAAGLTLRKIATAVLPVTGCPDLPSCEEILAARLASGAARPVV